jgi:hypothetical protein
VRVFHTKSHFVFLVITLIASTTIGYLHVFTGCIGVKLEPSWLTATKFCTNIFQKSDLIVKL